MIFMSSKKQQLSFQEEARKIHTSVSTRGKNNCLNEWMSCSVSLSYLVKLWREGSRKKEDKEGGVREEASVNKRLPPY